MQLFTYPKMQIACLIILIFISYLFIKDGNRLNKKTHDRKCNPLFDYLFILGEVALLFDIITCYTVNNLDVVPVGLNLCLHLIYLMSYQLFIFVHFLYWLKITESLPKKWWAYMLVFAPICISLLITIIFINKLTFVNGTYTNYSMGISAIACFCAIGLYCVLTLIIYITHLNYIQRNRKTAFLLSISAVIVITVVQLFIPESLISGLAIVLVIISIYLCLENPTIKYLEFYHSEMVMGFATLVESKDGSTGGHIKRSSSYALIIAKELRKNPKYKKIITKDYLDDLEKAAPMHDIGKISIPDAILQKPGKLTNEEFEIMKTHPKVGCDIIKKTFGHLDDPEYENIAYDVALSHHERYDGKGYPEGLKGDEIPLCARIMGVADVFDAVSAKRCYRDAMPLDECFKIIEDGKGTQFDPDVVDAFFNKKEDIIKVYDKIK